MVPSEADPVFIHGIKENAMTIFDHAILLAASFEAASRIGCPERGGQFDLDGEVVAHMGDDDCVVALDGRVEHYGPYDM